ncbi:hypothetical protein EON66_09035, partial [archaeon]
MAKLCANRRQGSATTATALLPCRMPNARLVTSSPLLHCLTCEPAAHSRRCPHAGAMSSSQQLQQQQQQHARDASGSSSKAGFSEDTAGVGATLTARFLYPSGATYGMWASSA